MTDDIDRKLAATGRPRPLPAELRQRLADVLLAATGAVDEELDRPVDGLVDLDAERPLPAEVRARLHRRLVADPAPAAGRRRRTATALTTAAAVAALVAGGLVLGGVPGSEEPARVAEPRATVVAMPASSPTAAPVAGSAGRPQRTGTERAGGVAAPEPSRVFAGNRAHKAADALSSGDRLSPVSIEDWLRQLRRAVRAWWRPGHWF